MRLERSNEAAYLWGLKADAALSSCPADTIAEPALRFGQADDIKVISVVATYA